MKLKFLSFWPCSGMNLILHVACQNLVILPWVNCCPSVWEHPYRIRCLFSERREEEEHAEALRIKVEHGNCIVFSLPHYSSVSESHAQGETEDMTTSGSWYHDHSRRNRLSESAFITLIPRGNGSLKHEQFVKLDLCFMSVNFFVSFSFCGNMPFSHVHEMYSFRAWTSRLPGNARFLQGSVHIWARRC